MKKIVIFILLSVGILDLQAQNILDSIASSVKFRSIGPSFMSGRVADIAIHPNNHHIWYVAIGSGGVWKTENAGTTWKPLFDKQSVYSIGCISIDQQNPNSIWVGTGENVGGRHVGFGDGIYHSSDGGKSWKNMGLKESEHISKILIHPTNSNIIWVAAQGPLWSSGGERGLYKTTDGGKTWKNTLEVNEWTGVTELVMDPRNPDRLYCASWQRHRTIATYLGGGPGTALYASSDGGETWEKLKSGLPHSNMGKIGLAISPQNPDVLYAAIELDRRKGGVYRSEDQGASWEKMSDAVSGATGPHYYQELYASPHVFDKIYLVDVRMQVSEDGGKTFKRMNEKHKHSDNHAIAWRADDPNYILVGCDGGLYESYDAEKTWKFHGNIPTVQYYKLAVDDAEPFYNIYGGTQDNNTHGGPSRTLNNRGIRNADWHITLGGDGHQPATEPGNPNILYCQSQQGHLNRVDLQSWERYNIRPTAQEGEPYERYNWDAPILVSPHNPTKLFFASQRLWMSENRGDSWTALSGDLTKNEERIELDIMGGKQAWENAWDFYAMSNYNTITSISESPLVEGLIYIGTDDGLLQITEDNGANWRTVEVSKLPGCPSTAYVNDIKADKFNADALFVALDNHKYGDYQPYLYRSVDRGKSWKKCTNSLPEKLLLWRIVQDHVDKNLLFLGTEFGIYGSIDGGQSWSKFASLPTISFRDLAIQKRENDLVAASFGRGFYVLDDYSFLRDLKEVGEGSIMFQMREADWYMPKRMVAGGQGAGSYVAPNPQYGARFSYYHSEGSESLKSARRKNEKAKKDAGEEYQFPGWDALESEGRELNSSSYIVIKNSSGEVVRRIKASEAKGLHQAHWDLRHFGTRRIRVNDGQHHTSPGLMCSPGTYTAQLERFENGTWAEVGTSIQFEVVRINEPSLQKDDLETTLVFWRELEKISGEMSVYNYKLNRSKTQIKTYIAALQQVRSVDSSLVKDLSELHQRIQKLDLQMNGYQTKSEVGQKNDPRISDRFWSVMGGVSHSTYGISDLHKSTLGIVKKDFAEVKVQVDDIFEKDLPAIRLRLQESGAPYIEGN